MQPTRITPLGCLLLGVVLLAHCLATAARAATVSWTNPAGGDWNTATNWSTGTVPAAGDAVFIATDGTYTVSLNVSAAVASLTLGGAGGQQTLAINGQNLNLANSSVVTTGGVLSLSDGALGGAGVLTVNGLVRFSGGWLQGAVSIAANGLLDFREGLDKGISGTVANQGTMVWSGTNNLVIFDGRINNLAAGVFEIQNDQTILGTHITQVFSNAGLVRKVAGTGVTTFSGVPFDNTGTVDVRTGAISYASGSVFRNDTAFTGAGTNLLAGGTVMLDGTIHSENLELGGATVIGTNTLAGTMRWTGGVIGSGAFFTVSADGTLYISGSANRTVAGVLNNGGQVIWSGTTNLVIFDGQINNLAAGVFEIQNDQTILGTHITQVFSNAGVVRKVAGSGVTTFSGVPFDNTGTVEVQSGAISYANGSVFRNDTAFTGAGTNLLADRTVMLDGTIHSENLELGGATVIGTNTLAGTMRWTGGAIGFGAFFTVSADGTLYISGSANRTVAGVLNNAGQVVWSGTNTLAIFDGAINNLTNGVFEIQNDQTILGGHITQVFSNAGLVRKVAGPGVTTFNGVPFINTGTVEVQTGTVSYASGSVFENGTSLIGAGTNLLALGRVGLEGTIHSENLELGGAEVVGTSTNTGTVRWTGGSIGSGASFTVATNGMLDITGSSNRAVFGVLNNGGQVVWSGTTNLVIFDGQINNLAGGVFEIQNDQTILGGHVNQVFSNAGLVRKVAGSGVTTFSGVPFDNTGTAEVQSGAISYANGSVFRNDTTFTGAGTNLLADRTVMLDGTIHSENLELGGATVIGTNTITGTMRWTGGVIGSGASFTVAANGLLHIAGSTDRTVAGTLNNAGQVVWSGTNTLAIFDGAINNLSNGVFEVQNDQVILGMHVTQVFNNAGLVRKAGGPGVTTFQNVPFHNTGTVEVRSGTVSYAGGSVFENGTVLVGTGTNLLANGRVRLDGTIRSENLEMGGAEVVGTSTNTGTVRWTGGVIGSGASFTVATNGMLDITGSSNRAVFGILNNGGQVVWSGTTNLVIFDGQINNLAGGVFEIQNDQTILGGHVTQVFNNAGLVRKVAGSGVTTFQGVPFNNTGAVDVQMGSVQFGAAYTQTGGRLNFGLNSLTNFGRIQCAGNTPLTGTLSVNLNGGYAPRAGDSFALLSYPAHTGAFTGFDLPPLAAWQTNDTIYGASGVSLTVLNARPTLAATGDTTMNEETPITLQFTATDPDLGQTITYSLTNAPPGATVISSTGAFSWTPTEAQGPSTNRMTVRVTDNGTPVLSHTQTFVVVVNEVNRGPTLLPPGPQTVNELTALVVTNAATDPDLPTNALMFRLVSAPTGVALDATNGVLTWIPTEAQGPSTNTITVRVTDTNPDAVNEKQLSATNSFTVVVRELNRPPSLIVPGPQTVVEGLSLMTTVSATDPDLPANSFTFSLVSAPSGAALDPTNGVLTWTPAPDQVSSTNLITVRVADNNPDAVNQKQLSDEKSFVATVLPPPTLTIAWSDNDVLVGWPAYYPGAVLQSTTNAAAPRLWSIVTNPPATIGDQTVVTNAIDSGQRIYRLELR